MRGNFERCLVQVLRHEGGWSDHPDDPGGATMKGITLATYRSYRPGATKADLRAISEAEITAIYRAGYWDKVKGDDLPTGLDLVAFDSAVNSGPSRGAKWLQAALGVVADGQIGPATLAAAIGHPDQGAVIRSACDRRLGFLKALPTWPKFGKGWSRRVEAVRAEALAMLDQALTAKSAAPPPKLPLWLAAISGFLKRILRGSK